MSKELELKLLVAPSACAELITLAPLADLESRAFPLLNRYLDTPDRVLSQAGIALRLRYQDGGWLQTLKTRGSSGQGLHQRNEWEMPVSAAALEWDRLPADALPENLAKDQVEVLFETNFERRVWLVTSAQATIEVALDQGSVLAAGRETPISELELELKEGNVVAVFDLAEQLATQVPLMPYDISKAERGLALLNGTVATPDWPEETGPGVWRVQHSREEWFEHNEK